MGIFPACLWPVVIYPAIIIFIEKGAWGRLQDVIAVFIYPQILLYEIAGFHPEGSGDPLNVILVEDRTGGLATVGTRKAIDLFENFLMHAVKHVIDHAGVLFLQLREKFPVFLFPVSGLYPKLFLIHLSVELSSANIVKDHQTPFMNLTSAAVVTEAPRDVLTEKPRIASIDVMRGIVMVIMALDHARDFFHADAFVYDPTDLEKTTPVLFLTRFITHFCAPTFVLLAGTAVRISQQRKTKREMSWFLFSRGMWLVLLEVTVVRFSMLFQWHYDVTIFQVIWAIGFCMVLFSAIIHLPFRYVLALGILITFGHDVLHAIQLQQGDTFLIPWTFIHQSGFIQLVPDAFAFVAYPFLPWLGILLLGYGLGQLYTKGFDSAVRRKLLLRMGILALVLFTILRYYNIYGDPSPWSEQKDGVYTFLSFINVTKYPVSLQYTLLTLGPVLILLSLLENLRTNSLRPFGIIGRVPLFYYVLHFYLLHLAALGLYMARTGKSITEIDFHFNATFGGLPPGDGYPLIAAYIAWLSVVLILYPLCYWYNSYKSKHAHWWLSYM